MPSISLRAFAGELAKARGFTEPLGHLYARDMQLLGLVRVGARGGKNGSNGERATSRHAVLLLLAMGAQLSRPNALRLARKVYELPFNGSVQYAADGRPEPLPLPPPDGSFGDELVAVIDAYRAGFRFPAHIWLHEIGFGLVDGAKPFGIVQMYRAFQSEDGGVGAIKTEAQFFDLREHAPAAPIYSRAFFYIPAAALEIAANILGPLVGSGGGGGEKLPVSDEAFPKPTEQLDELPVAAQPMAESDGAALPSAAPLAPSSAQPLPQSDAGGGL